MHTRIQAFALSFPNPACPGRFCQDFDACTECGRCTAACPANRVGKLLSPRDIILDLQRLARDGGRETGAGPAGRLRLPRGAGPRGTTPCRDAHNFQLGKITRLGPSAALGKRNVSHTFSVTLNLPALENEEQRKERQRKIEGIIESEKPVHTAYTLTITETD